MKPNIISIILTTVLIACMGTGYFMISDKISKVQASIIKIQQPKVETVSLAGLEDKIGEVKAAVDKINQTPQTPVAPVLAKVAAAPCKCKKIHHHKVKKHLRKRFTCK